MLPRMAEIPFAIIILTLSWSVNVFYFYFFPFQNKGKILKLVEMEFTSHHLLFVGGSSLFFLHLPSFCLSYDLEYHVQINYVYSCYLIARLFVAGLFLKV
ncbi:hypothetical protein AABB24_033764 [Solanum stoloniferum]|uniref:Uncharacterized protein n=1 Tax=Solanum stoloniferum TaxID=62892 RepID=A0ABD2RCY8_9SOLN